MKYTALFILLFLFTLPTQGFAEETYADVSIPAVPHWTMQKKQTYTGTTPSRTWLFTKNDEEVMVGVLVTEGIVGGLKGQNYGNLAKVYLDALIAGWGGKRNGPEAGSTALFCGGEPGYKTEGIFGERRFDYYCCLKVSKDRSRIAVAVTWGNSGLPEETAARRLMPFIESIQFPLPETE
ncbi:MAG: hypothetical protein IJU23_13390 [Proteobacteria bacterium]|nr:hypothetical protein [Pseudomonadota bacterium]